MNKVKLCASITNTDIDALKEVESIVDMFEVRIDIIGDEWTKVVPYLTKPWIACNRMVEEGGKWEGNEARRIERLLQAIELGAEIVDIECNAKNVKNVINLTRKKAKCLLSFHDFEKTSSFETLKQIVNKELKYGADICKIVTTAKKFEDNLEVMRLYSEFPDTKMIAFTMGPHGFTSRIMAPLIGAYFTYGAVKKGAESASGQLPVSDMMAIYKMVAL
jgi:3-dehydroquinate dehydratase type I